MARTTLEAVVAELYALGPGEFVSRRNTFSKELRGRDRALADRVAALPKPTAAAWAVNHFARVRVDELTGLLALGTQLRKAHADLDAQRMRELNGQTHAAVQGVVRSVAAVAKDAGTSLGDGVRDQVEQTLRAALADERASEAVRTGVLTRPLVAGGFGPVDLEGAVAVEQAVAVEPALPRKRHLSVVRSAPPAARGPGTQGSAPIGKRPPESRERSARQDLEQAVRRERAAVAAAESARRALDPLA